jgi:hypothetical protein
LNNRVWQERVLSRVYRQMTDESENGGTEKRAVICRGTINVVEIEPECQSAVLSNAF